MASPPPHIIDLPRKVRNLLADRQRLRLRAEQAEAERDEYKRQIDELCSLFDDVDADVEAEAQPQLVVEPDRSTAPTNPTSKPLPPCGRYLDVLAVLCTDTDSWWTSAEIARLLVHWPDHLQFSYRVSNYLKKGRDCGDIEHGLDGNTHLHRITAQGLRRAQNPTSQPQPQSDVKPKPKKAAKNPRNKRKAKPKAGRPTAVALVLEELRKAQEFESGWLFSADLSQRIDRKSTAVASALANLVQRNRVIACPDPHSNHRHPRKAYALPGVTTQPDFEGKPQTKPGPKTSDDPAPKAIDDEALEVFGYVTKKAKGLEQIARECGHDRDLTFAFLAHLEAHKLIVCGEDGWRRLREWDRKEAA